MPRSCRSRSISHRSFPRSFHLGNAMVGCDAGGISPDEALQQRTGITQDVAYAYRISAGLTSLARESSCLLSSPAGRPSGARRVTNQHVAAHGPSRGIRQNPCRCPPKPAAYCPHAESVPRPAGFSAQGPRSPILNQGAGSAEPGLAAHSPYDRPTLDAYRERLESFRSDMLLRHGSTIHIRVGPGSRPRTRAPSPRPLPRSRWS
jgi:hypothetical protein